MNPFIISTLLICLFPFFCVVAVYLYRLLEQRLPANQRAALDEFVMMAVRAIWLANGADTDAQKIQLAVQAVKDLFNEFGLPVPSDEVIMLAVEAAILLIKQMPAQSMNVAAIETYKLSAVNSVK